MNIQKLTIISHDKRLSTVITQFLPQMTQLKIIFLGSKVPNVKRCLEHMKRLVPNLKRIYVAQPFMVVAKRILGPGVKVIKIKDVFFEGKERRMRFHCLYNDVEFD